MKKDDLKNYGKSDLDMIPDEKSVKKLENAMFYELKNELGFFNAIFFILKAKKDEKKFLVQKRKNTKSIDNQFFSLALPSMILMKNLSERIGKEKAAKIFFKVLDENAYNVFASIFPAIDDFRKLGNVISGISSYVKAYNKANEKNGTHKNKIAKDSKDVFQSNCTYCAYHELAKELGDPYYCYATTCYADEVFYIRQLVQTEFQFSRKGTLATGAKLCDFKWERINK